MSIIMTAVKRCITVMFCWDNDKNTMMYLIALGTDDILQIITEIRSVSSDIRICGFLVAQLTFAAALFMYI